MSARAASEVERLAASIRARGVASAEIAFVLGAGLGAFAERVERALSIPYAELEGMPCSAVAGHAGRLVAGEIAGRRVLVLQGRVHLYEGWDVHAVTRAVRAAARLGAATFVLTNAAGGLRREWPPGTLMAITDHLNLQGRSPIARSESGYGTPYDAASRAAFEQVARELGLELPSGAYAGLLGPSYETPAEVRALRAFGADAVGMSTVAEALAARAAGARVAGISLITNHAAGITGEPLSHAEVVAAGAEAAGRFSTLLERALPRL
jgi:purine-nucleoside phosphorylase